MDFQTFVDPCLTEKPKNACSKCNKLFLQSTLDKYDGSTCGVCFNKTHKESKEYKKQPIPKELRKRVWLERIGDKVLSRCFICDKKIDSFTFDCAHIVPEVYGGEMMLENLHVTCSTCNKSCGKMNLNDYKKLFPKDFYKKKYNVQLIVSIITLVLMICLFIVESIRRA